MVRLARSLSIAVATSIGLVVSTAGIFAASMAQAADVFRVAYAGSMGAVMDQFIGPTFAKANGVEYQGIGQGSLGLAAVGRQAIAGRCVRSDHAGPDRHCEKGWHDRNGRAGG
jgi:ABC-type molybdate transport system substrate-binding protein